MNIRGRAMLSSLVPMLAFAAAAAAAAACDRGRTFLDRERALCTPCTRCNNSQAVKYPCEPHRDTVCQPLTEAKLWPHNNHNRNDSEVSDYEYYEYVDYSEVRSDDWGVEASTLTLAACGCLVFFVVVLCMSLYHAKQWRLLKKALKQDVQDLSAKLRLMEAGAEPTTEQDIPSDHHMYCNIHIAKPVLLAPATGKKGLGNVYTQEKHP